MKSPSRFSHPRFSHQLISHQPISRSHFGLVPLFLGLLIAASLSLSSAAAPPKNTKAKDSAAEAAAAAAATNALIAAATALPAPANKETAKEATKEAAKESPKEMVSEVSKPASKEVANEAAKEVVKDGAKDAPKEMSKVATEATKEAPKEIAKEITKAPVPSAPAPNGSKSFLWEVKSKSNTVYLFGTIHLGKKEFYPLPPAVEDALSRAKIVVVEADITKAENSTEIERLISYTPPDNLEKQISAPLYARLSTQLTKLKFPPDGVKMMKPFLVGGFIAVADFTRLGYDMKYGVDAYLLGKAQGEKKTILELESQLGQIKLLANLSAGQQEAFLDNALQTVESDSSAEMINGLVKAWQSGDTVQLQEIAKNIGKRGKRSDELDEVMIYSRHDAMLKKIEGYLASNDLHFVAVGSLHLVGSRGLIDLLRAKGYQIRQL
jgi:uncharacterized protein